MVLDRFNSDKSLKIQSWSVFELKIVKLRPQFRVRNSDRILEVGFRI